MPQGQALDMRSFNQIAITDQTLAAALADIWILIP
jgi:hypothetical protein